MTEQSLTDALLRNALELQRLADSDAIKADKILRELEQDLRILLNSRELSAASRREINAIIRQAQEAITGRYVNIAGVVDTSGIAEHVAERTLEAVRATFPAAVAPSIQTLRSLATNILIEGAPSAAWWAKQSEDAAFKFAGAVRQGVVNGHTNEQIVRAVVGSRGETGILDVARRNVRALVHSSVMTSANHARLAVYDKVFRNGFRWLATLDSHTCQICMALDGKEWDQDGKAVGHKFDKQAPPAHWNCRCVATPRPVSFNEKYGVTGADEAMAKVGARPSANGMQKSGTTFADFLKRQPDSFVRDVLGKRRAELYIGGRSP